MKSVRFLFLLMLVVAHSDGLWAQNPSNPREVGRRLGHFYSPEKLGGQLQNHDILQDERGLIYIANNSGVLEYDGVQTRGIRLPHRAAALFLSLGQHNRVFVGGYNELGYLAPDSTGSLSFQSLKTRVPDSLQDLGTYWRTEVLGGDVFFGAKTFLLQIDQASLQVKKIWSHDPRISLFVVDGHAYIWRTGLGPARIEGDRLVELNSSFAQDDLVVLRPFFQASGPESGPIAYSHITQQAEQIPFQAGKRPMPIVWDDEITPLWEKGNVSDFRSLGEKGYLIATQSKGLFLLDSKGKFVEPLNPETGLAGIHDPFPSLLVDKAQGLWVIPEDQGVSKVEPFSPFSYLEEEEIGLVCSIIRHQGQLYIGTGKSIFRLVPSLMLGQAARWEKMCDLSGTFGFHSDGTSLYAAALNGVYLIDTKAERPARPLYQKGGDYFFIQASAYDSSLLYVGANSAVKILKQKEGGLQFCGEIKVEGEIRSLVETAPDTLWLGTFSMGLQRFVSQDSISKDIRRQAEGSLISGELTSFRTDKGIPTGLVSVCKVAGQLLVTTSEGYRRYQASSQSMVPETRFGPQMGDAKTFTYLTVEDAKGRVYSLIDDNVPSPSQRASIARMTPTQAGGYELETTLFNRLPQTQIFGTQALYADPADPDILWMAGKVILRFDASKARPLADSFPVYLRRIRSRGDTVIFHNDGGSPNHKQVAYAFNKLRFEFAAPFFQSEEETHYSIILEGFDEEWSEWSDETYATYTNLPEGAYQFRVRARNIAHIISESTPFELVILPPWYRSVWAYALYGLLGLLLMTALVYSYTRWRTRQLQARNRELSQVVEERTAELQVKNERLQELDDFKSRFFTNISHEFRTPLTVIGGMMDQIRAHPDRWVEKGGQIINRNVGNLLSLINQILDLRKLESGKLQLHLIQDDVVQFLRYGTESFESYASGQSLDLQFHTALDTLVMDFDPDKLLLIQTNLISNAIKFTPEGGRVQVSVKKAAGKSLQLQVADTGRGIPPAKLPFVFDRFYQVDQSDTREGEGTGIGLSLTKALVELMKGEIQVKSELGQGSVFTVLLPIQKNAPLQSIPSPPPRVEPSALPLDAIPVPSPSPANKALPSLLIIEDNPDIVSYLYACLDGQYELSSAPDGQAGIEAAFEQVPDLILTDVMMPYKNGYEVTETLKLDERSSHIPIVMLTAKADHESRMEGYKRGADAYLAKPFKEEELHIRLQKLHELRLKLQARYQGTTPPAPSEDPAIQQEDAFVIRIRELILAHLDDSSYKGESLMKDLGIGRTNLHRKIKALTGLPISRFMHEVRIEQAREMLKSDNMQVAEVGYATGYNDPAYFGRIFREVVGQSPGEWRGQELDKKP